MLEALERVADDEGPFFDPDDQRRRPVRSILGVDSNVVVLTRRVEALDPPLDVLAGDHVTLADAEVSEHNGSGLA